MKSNRTDLNPPIVTSSLQSDGRLRTVVDRSSPSDCLSCGEGMPKGECSESERECGHHCNHSWSHGSCDWCGEDFGEQNPRN